MRLFLLFCLCAVPGCGSVMADMDLAERARWRVKLAKEIELFEPEQRVDDAKPDKVPSSQCTVCNGTGTVLSGDGLHRVACSNCYEEDNGLLPPKQAVKPRLKLRPKPKPVPVDPKPATPKMPPPANNEQTVATEYQGRSGFFRRGSGFLRRLLRCNR